MNCNFVHLHVHTEYSIVDGLLRIPALIEAAAAMGMPALALTDQTNLFGWVKFYKAAIAKGIKPIIGSDLWISDGKQLSRLVALCQNQAGYLNLTRLISYAYLEGQQQGKPVVSLKWLEELHHGLIILSGGREGDVGQAILADNIAQAEKHLLRWKTLLGDRYYLELQRTGREQEENYIHGAIDFASRHTIPVVATNDVRFLKPEDFEAHEARVCIQEGWTLADPNRHNHYSEQQYLRSASEMMDLFSDMPEALENTLEIAKRCNVELKLGEYFLPKYPVPADVSLERFLEEEALKGLEKRLRVILGDHEDKEKRAQYETRLKLECDVINRMGYAGYFLIVADFIRWAKANGVPVGPGRGSGAGSLVAFALEITDLDPIALDLLFERFLNPERVSMPDFDIDFCMEGRDRVIEYVAQKYGRDCVSQIITYGSMAARAVVRDVGRVLGHPYGFVDKLAKLIPFELGMTLKKALQQEDRLLEKYQTEEEVKALIDLAIKLEGLTRNAGKHAGGVVIAPSKLTDFAPIYCEENGAHPVTQFDKDDVEAVGLVKFDFLGLRTLTIIDWAVQSINRKCNGGGEGLLDIARIPLDDEKTYALLQSGKTTAVFQLESRGMKDLLRRVKPDNFEDIIALVALFRPGPLQSGMVDDFINRKHGRAKVEYPHPLLEALLRPTYGVILYQEQVMQIAQVLAGYTLGGADLLRRAMGKKKPEEMAKQRAIFVEGSVKRGIDAHLANEIFDLMEKFAGYGFNKSHSAAYALLAYQTAWLKTHYPAEFMAAVLSSEMHHTDKVVGFVNDCKEFNLQLEPPDINQSYYRFTVTEQGTIRYGLGAIKGVGENAIESILEARQQQPFTSLFDFCHRVDTRKVNRRVLEALIQAGAMDCFQIERASLFASIEKAVQLAEQQQRNLELGQQDLFAHEPIVSALSSNSAYVSAPAWGDLERLKREKTVLGCYLTGHPLARAKGELAHLVTSAIAELRVTDRAIVAGLITSLRTVQTKSGDRMAVLTLEDDSGRVDVVVFSDTYAKVRDLLIEDECIVVEGEASQDEFSGGIRLRATQLFSLTQARERSAKAILLKLNEQSFQKDFQQQLRKLLLKYQGGRCPVMIEYQNNTAKGKITLGSEWKVTPHENLLDQLVQLCASESAVSVLY